MPTPTNSFEKFNYSIRPSKQVERKLFIEAFHALAHGTEYCIKNYAYIGMGSVFYTDFVLFHKYLYIDEMLCIECADIKPRMKFNKPYKFIKLKMGKVSDIIPKIPFRNKLQIVWLDYDSNLDQEALLDIDCFIRKLSPGSFFIVTVDAEPKLRNNNQFSDLSKSEKTDLLIAHYNSCSNGLLPELVKARDVSKNTLPNLLIKVINAKIQKAISFREDDAQFTQLFDYLYADGAQMLSFGGIIDYSSKVMALKNSSIMSHPSIVSESSPRKIMVPPLTQKEKCLLDSLIKKGIKFSNIKEKIPFDLSETQVENYISFYRHYPCYYESVV